jgi:hypothetical protein
MFYVRENYAQDTDRRSRELLIRALEAVPLPEKEVLLLAAYYRVHFSATGVSPRGSYRRRFRALPPRVHQRQVT